MKIKVYAICWNEEVIAPYFLRHYKKYTSEIVIYDNMSTDSTCEILRSCEIRKYDTNEKIRDDIYLSIKNEAWKETRDSEVDWVIVCDMDEFVYSTDLLNTLRKAKEDGYTIIKPQGYSMIGDNIPIANGMIYDEIPTGVKDNNYSKLCIFNPNSISEINYAPGCHDAQVCGDVNVLLSSNIKLLHYNYISLDYAINRYSTYETRLSEENLRNGWGTHYQYKKDIIIREYEQFKQNSKDVT